MPQTAEVRGLRPLVRGMHSQPGRSDPGGACKPTCGRGMKAVAQRNARSVPKGGSLGIDAGDGV